MSTTLEPPTTPVRPRSWRDALFAAYEADQVRLRRLIAEGEEPEEHI